MTWPLYSDYDGQRCRCGFTVDQGRIWRYPSRRCGKHRGLPASYQTIGAH